MKPLRRPVRRAGCGRIETRAKVRHAGTAHLKQARASTMCGIAAVLLPRRRPPAPGGSRPGVAVRELLRVPRRRHRRLALRGLLPGGRRPRSTIAHVGCTGLIGPGDLRPGRLDRAAASALRARIARRAGRRHSPHRPTARPTSRFLLAQADRRASPFRHRQAAGPAPARRRPATSPSGSRTAHDRLADAEGVPKQRRYAASRRARRPDFPLMRPAVTSSRRALRGAARRFDDALLAPGGSAGRVEVRRRPRAGSSGAPGRCGSGRRGKSCVTKPAIVAATTTLPKQQRADGKIIILKQAAAGAVHAAAAAHRATLTKVLTNAPDRLLHRL